MPMHRFGTPRMPLASLTPLLCRGSWSLLQPFQHGERAPAPRRGREVVGPLHARLRTADLPLAVPDLVDAEGRLPLVGAFRLRQVDCPGLLRRVDLARAPCEDLAVGLQFPD